MSDQHAPADNHADDEPLEPADELPEPDETEIPPGDDEPADDDNANDDESAGDGPEQRTARGQPDATQRDRRLSRQEAFNRAVDAAVERRLGRQTQQRPSVDFAEQQRQLQQRRTSELETARLEGSERYAEVLNRHSREDMDARSQFFAAQQQDDRNQTQFDRLCSRNTVYDAVRDEVEDEVGKLRSNGAQFVDRKVVADVILGRRYAERASKQGGQQRRRAGAETQRQTVRAPSNNASQQPASRRRGNVPDSDLSVEEFERRYGGVPVRAGSAS